MGLVGNNAFGGCGTGLFGDSCALLFFIILFLLLFTNSGYAGGVNNANC